jgi:hypothetical protein
MSTIKASIKILYVNNTNIINKTEIWANMTVKNGGNFEPQYAPSNFFDLMRLDFYTILLRKRIYPILLKIQKKQNPAHIANK